MKKNENENGSYWKDRFECIPESAIGEVERTGGSRGFDDPIHWKCIVLGFRSAFESQVLAIKTVIVSSFRDFHMTITGDQIGIEQKSRAESKNRKIEKTKKQI